MGLVFLGASSFLFYCRKKYSVKNNALKSPINLIDKINVIFHYTDPFKGSVGVVCEEVSEQGFSKEYMVEVRPDGASKTDNYVLVDSKKYYLTQFHFHVPSEHMVNGVRKEAEVYFVPTAKTGEKAVVVGAFITDGVKVDEAYQAILKELPPLLKILPKCPGE